MHTVYSVIPLLHETEQFFIIIYQTVHISIIGPKYGSGVYVIYDISFRYLTQIDTALVM